MKYLLNVLIIAFVLNAAAFAQNPVEAVPQFDFYKLDNSVFTNKNLASSKQLLFVFFDVTCEHCHKAIRQFNEHYKELEKAGVYLISLDTPQSIMNFLNSNGKNLTAMKNVTILRDSKNEFIVRFRPKKYPSIFLFSPQKKLILYSDEEKNVPVFLKEIKAAGKK